MPLSGCKGYLIGSQASDGSWGSGDPLVCGRALLACDLLEAPEDTVKKGLAYLESCQSKDGCFKGKTQVYTDAANTAYALIVMNRFDYSKATIAGNRGLMWLFEHQAEDGSWSGRNSTKKAYTTSICARALYTYNLYHMNRYKKAVGFVLEYVRGMDFDQEVVSHVYAPVLNLKRINVLDEEIEKRFVGYANSRIKPAMENGDITDVAYITGTLAAIDGKEAHQDIFNWLRSVQNGDGGFGYKKGDASEPNWTALVTLSLLNRL